MKVPDQGVFGWMVIQANKGDTSGYTNATPLMVPSTTSF